MRVRRGLFRLWIVASILWIVGIIWWMNHQSAEFADGMIRLGCEFPSPEFGVCVREKRELGYRDFWFKMKSLELWAFVALVPILALIAGWIALKVSTWVTRGFRE